MNAFWFRRDLRIHDNHGLFQCLKEKDLTLPVFIFDKKILNHLPKKDARVEFILEQLKKINDEIVPSQIHIEYGDPVQVWPKLIKQFKINKIFCNHDYEPYALERDTQIQSVAKAEGVEFVSFKDQVIFEKAEVTKDDGKPYTVFTPYSKKWKAKLGAQDLVSFPSDKHLSSLLPHKETFMGLVDLGFEKSDQSFPSRTVSQNLLKNYQADRNLPFKHSTSRLGLHLRFGTISIRHVVRVAKQLSETWLNELIWREFFQMILFHFPHSVTHSFKPPYDKIQWRNNEKEFQAWCDGRTGYPIVDAGMRELNATGFMHNRVRMITASFLVKHLLIDWRWGEKYFAEKLQDYELASNVGNWQWAAGSGCDAAPYFRVFNPELQMKKFDPDRLYIKQWIPEFGTEHYPEPIVDHVVGRLRVLKAYEAALKGPL